MGTSRYARSARGHSTRRRRAVGALATVALVAVAVPAMQVGAARRPAHSAVQPAASIGPFNVNVASREDVRQFYNVVYKSAVDVPLGWTGGDVANCVKGTVSPAWLSATLSRTNYFRTMAGIPAVTYNGTDAGTTADPNNSKAQAAALLRLRNPGAEAHGPSQSAAPNCWTQEAFDGTSGNQAGGTGTDAVDALMYDGTALGHRRNMLDPSIATMGAGALPSVGGSPSFFVHTVLTPPLPSRPPVRSGFVAWPNEGFVPYQVVPARWSFSLPNTNFSQATVSMQRNGVTVPTQRRCYDPYPTPNDGTLCGLYGETALSWTANNVADNAPWPRPAADETYTVTITNAIVNGVAQNFSYRVTVIDPAVGDAAHTIGRPQGPVAPKTNTNPTYTVGPVADASGYQWRTTPVSPFTLTDGAENGLANFDAETFDARNNIQYNPIDTDIKANGEAGFHLAGSNNRFTSKLTLKQSLVADASSQVTFLSDLEAFDNLEARVEVSSDDGATWVPVWTQTKTGSEGLFTPKVVSLAAFAGRTIKMRLAMLYPACCGSTFGGNAGWHVDDVTFVNLRAAGTPVLRAVGPNPSFVLQNPQAGSFSIDVRPQFTNPTFGAGFGDWSPSLQVTSVVAPTSLVTLASSANPSNSDQQVTFTATVNPTDDGGTVSFTDDGDPIPSCQARAVTGGTATCARSYSDGGVHSVVATYSGDANFDGSTSPPLIQNVNGARETATSVTSSKTPAVTGEPVTFTATVDPNVEGGGTVAFKNSATTIPGCGAQPLTAAGQATCTTSFASSGLAKQISAVYSGTVNLAPSTGVVAQNVYQPTSTSLTSSANPSTAGQQVTFTATVSPTNGDGVVFFDGSDGAIPGCNGVPISEAGVATCSVTFASNGPQQIDALYGGSDTNNQFFLGSASIPLSQRVGALSSSSTTLAVSANPVTPGADFTYTATVTASNLGGTVAFHDGDNSAQAGCGAVPVDGEGHATCVSNIREPGRTEHMRATYSGNGNAAGSTSSVLNVTATVPPAAVQNVAAANVRNGAAQVTFAAGAGALAAPEAATSPVNGITGFNVYMGTSPGNESTTPVNPSRISAAKTTRGFNVTGLTAGKKYYFKVRAINARGLGPLSAEVSTTVANTPSAPRSVVAVAGQQSVRLTWIAPASTGGRAITGYRVFQGTAPGEEAPAPVKSLAAGVTNTTITGLTNGKAHYFTLQATNGVALGAESAEVSATPRTVPSRPSNVAAYPRNASVVLVWRAADPNSTSPITGFNVYRGTAAGQQGSTPVNASPISRTATTYTAGGLTNGKKYFFTVKAVNGIGSSLASNEVSATPTAAATTPSAPRSLTARAANRSAILQWVAPQSNGGKPITGFNVYKATARGGQSAVPVNSSPLPANATSYTVTQLTNAARTYFTVKAINLVGPGIPSNEASAIPAAPATFPASPRGLTATGGNAKATLAWTAPAWNGGSAITGYNVYKATTSGGQTNTPVNASPLAPSARGYVVNGLSNGTKYFFTVKAINAIGSSAASNQASATPH